MKEAPTAKAEKAVSVAALLRPSRLQDPLLDAPVKTTPIPIYF